MSVSLSLGASETIWGFGGRGFGFVKNNRSMKNTFPVYYSDKGYALLCDHRDGASFSVGKDDPGTIEISVPGEQLSFHVISGKDPKEIIGNLRKLTGMPKLPSASGFGSWLFADPSTSYNAETIDLLHKEGFRICMNAGPFIRQDDILFAEGLEKGFFLKREDGRGIRQEDALPGAPALIDITDPDAAKWYAEKVKELLDKGVDGISSYYPELLTELLAEVNGAENKGEQVSFFSGNPGPDADSLIYRIGNTDGGFSHMAQCLRHGLSMLFGGTSYFSHEISQEMARTDPVVFKRWVQFGCFSTHFGIRLFEPGPQSSLFDGEELEVFKIF